MDLSALIYVPAYVGAVVFGFVFVLYMSHYYLTVLESSAAGDDDVNWVSESAIDYFPRMIYLVWLLGLWLYPALYVGRHLSLGSSVPWQPLANQLLVFWLLYPISQLSSLSASSIWYPLVPDVFVRIVQRPLVVLAYLVLSAGALMLFGLGFKWTFQTDRQWERLFLGSFFLVLGALLYAKVLGRVAYGLKFTKGLFEEVAKKKKSKKDTDSKPRNKPEQPQRVQPRDMPPIDTPDEGKIVGYDVKFHEEETPPLRPHAWTDEPGAKPAKELKPPGAKPARKIPVRVPKDMLEQNRAWTEEDEDDTPYGVHERPKGLGESDREELLTPSEEEVRLLRADAASRKLPWIWSPALLTFLTQPGTILVIVIASIMCSMTGLMIRIARMFDPLMGAGG